MITNMITNIITNNILMITISANRQRLDDVLLGPGAADGLRGGHAR